MLACLNIYRIVYRESSVGKWKMASSPPSPHKRRRRNRRIVVSSEEEEDDKEEKTVMRFAATAAMNAATTMTSLTNLDTSHMRGRPPNTTNTLAALIYSLANKVKKPKSKVCFYREE